MPPPRPTIAAAVLAVALVATGCLGPTEFDPTGTAPVGRIDRAVADGASALLVGWALDPDVTGPVQVSVIINQRQTDHTASVPRPDVARAYPRHGANHGFEIRTAALPPGDHQICVWVKNVGRGTKNRGLGCPVVRVGTDDPIGGFDAVQQVGPGRVRVVGWAYDPDGGPAQAEVRIGDSTHRITADQVRPDVNARIARPGAHGFASVLTVRTGRHQACMTAINQGRGASRPLGCKTVDVDDTPVVGPGAGISSVDIVRPPADHPLVNTERDAGITTRLANGSLFWLFGDTSEPDGRGGFKYFLNNTAALATAAKPTTTLDVVTGGRPHRFVQPTAAFTGGCPPDFSAVMWPTSAVTVPSPEGERVLSFFANVCLKEQTPRARGMALVEWTRPTPGAPLTGRVLSQNLFPVTAEFGSAAQMVGEHLYAYACGRPSDEQTGTKWPNDPAYSGCKVARVLPADAAQISEWEYWTGGRHTDDDSWSRRMGDAATMSMPSAGEDRQQPVSSFTITYDPHHGYVAVYSPWPGFTDRVVVRTAPSPVGPWSPVTEIRLPGCDEWAGGSGRHCYAGTAQPWRSTPTTLGVGYFDQYIAAGPLRGGYLSASAPVDLP